MLRSRVEKAESTRDAEAQGYFAETAVHWRDLADLQRDRIRTALNHVQAGILPP
jgi:hypothetical protein